MSYPLPSNSNGYLGMVKEKLEELKATCEALLLGNERLVQDNENLRSENERLLRTIEDLHAVREGAGHGTQVLQHEHIALIGEDDDDQVLYLVTKNVLPQRQAHPKCMQSHKLYPNVFPSGLRPHVNGTIQLSQLSYHITTSDPSDQSIYSTHTSLLLQVLEHDKDLTTPSHRHTETQATVAGICGKVDLNASQVMISNAIYPTKTTARALKASEHQDNHFGDACDSEQDNSAGGKNINNTDAALQMTSTTDNALAETGCVYHWIWGTCANHALTKCSIGSHTHSYQHKEFAFEKFGRNPNFYRHGQGFILRRPMLKEAKIYG